MAGKAERRAARERVGAYHEAELASLVQHIADEIDRYRTGEIDVVTVDHTIHHYHRAAQELWKFCWSGGGGQHIEFVAHTIEQQADAGEPVDWWERGRPRRERESGR